MRLWPSTLRARLTLWYAVALTVTLLLLSAVAASLLDRGMRQNVDDSLRSTARVIASSTRNPYPDTRNLDEVLESMLGPAFAERFFRLLDPLGRPDPRLSSRRRHGLYLSPRALQNAEHGRETYETVRRGGVDGTSVRLLTLPVLRGRRLVHLVQVGMSLRNAEEVRARFVFILLVLAPLAVGAAAVGGWFLARRALAPVDRMVAAAVRIEAEDLSQRIRNPPADDEIGRLATVLNEMLARLEGSFTTVRRFSADAAHELRTPLTILKGELEVASQGHVGEGEYQSVLDSCLEEVDRLIALVEDLLFLARSDAGAIPRPDAVVDLAEVVADVRPALQTLAENAGVTFAADAPSSVNVRGYAPMLFRLVFNLAENAIKYTPAGGRVECRLSETGASAVLEVRDGGPGIPPAEQARIFDRFYRGDPARHGGGSGLGLALAQSVAMAHGGRIEIDSEAGRGSRFVFRLPVSTPAT